MRKISFLFTILLFSSSLILAQNVKTGGDETLAVKGFISATFFGQNQSFGFANGQDAEWPEPPELTTNRWFYGGDVRNSRITMAFNGPDISDNWKLGGVLEFDAFGGFNGTGAFSAEQPTPRLRLAYADITHENLTIRLGQAWTPLFGNVPVSLSHIAFPLGYGSAGDIGWRFPGIYIYYKFNSEGSSTTFDLAAAVFEGSWSGPGSNVNFLNAGNAGTPQFEVRLNLSSKLSQQAALKAYIVGHFDQKNLAGVGDSTTVSLPGTAIEIGASLKVSGFLLHGNFFTGKNIGQQFGDLSQIQTVNKDLSSVGFWIQAGYDFTKEWGIYGFYGTENVDKTAAKQIFSDPKLSNNLLDFMLRFQTGPYSLGFEVLTSKLTYGADENTVSGTQIALSSLYKF
jgi:hypothetical protein